MTNRNEQVQQKLDSIALVARKYNIYDKSSFDTKYQFVHATLKEKAWAYALSKIQNREIIKNASTINEEEKKVAISKASKFSDDTHTLYSYLNQHFNPKDLRLTDENIERCLRNILAKRYVAAVDKEIQEILPKLTSTIKNRSSTFLHKFKTAFIILGIIGVFSIPRIIKGLTPVETLAERIHEKSKRKFNGAVCNDGSISHSQGRGTCSWHGGVDYYFYEGDYTKTMEECRAEARKISWLDK